MSKHNQYWLYEKDGFYVSTNRVENAVKAGYTEHHVIDYSAYIDKSNRLDAIGYRENYSERKVKLLDDLERRGFYYSGVNGGTSLDQTIRIILDTLIFLVEKSNNAKSEDSNES